MITVLIYGPNARGADLHLAMPLDPYGQSLATKILYRRLAMAAGLLAGEYGQLDCTRRRSFIRCIRQQRSTAYIGTPLSVYLIQVYWLQSKAAGSSAVTRPISTRARGDGRKSIIRCFTAAAAGEPCACGQI